MSNIGSHVDLSSYAEQYQGIWLQKNVSESAREAFPRAGPERSTRTPLLADVRAADDRPTNADSSFPSTDSPTPADRSHVVHAWFVMNRLGTLSLRVPHNTSLRASPTCSGRFRVVLTAVQGNYNRAFGTQSSSHCNLHYPSKQSVTMTTLESEVEYLRSLRTQ
jgi:hypothetical protein